MPSLAASARVAVLAVILAAPLGSLRAEPAAPLTLDDCVRRALTRNFDVELGQFDTSNAAAAVSLARSAFDPVLRASSTRSGSRTEGAANAASGWDTRLGVAQHLATGADVTLSTALNRTAHRFVSPYNPAYDSDVSLSLNQPLLKVLGNADAGVPTVGGVGGAFGAGAGAGAGGAEDGIEAGAGGVDGGGGVGGVEAAEFDVEVAGEGAADAVVEREGGGGGFGGRGFGVAGGRERGAEQDQGGDAGEGGSKCHGRRRRGGDGGSFVRDGRAGV